MPLVPFFSSRSHLCFPRSNLELDSLQVRFLLDGGKEDDQDRRMGAVIEGRPVRGVLDLSYQDVLGNRILRALLEHVRATQAGNHQDHHTVTTEVALLRRLASCQNAIVSC